MRLLAAIAGLALLLVILWDCFETIILPRRVTREFRITRAFYRVTWKAWSAAARRRSLGRFRTAYLSYYGPLSLLLLFVVWVAALIVSFGLLHWAAGSAINVQGGPPSFLSDLYLSGTTFFTLGIGDVTPHSELARLITVVESGTGFGLLAIVISYLPVLYGSFSEREVNISLLDARAGSPPTAGELLRRHAAPEHSAALIEYLQEWERWSAELMESHLSYPILCYFRSQHSNQSWIAGLTTILDASAFLMAYGPESIRFQAQLTYAIARHAVVDLAVVVAAPPRPPAADRLPAEDRNLLLESLASAGMALKTTGGEEVLARLRPAYEPYLVALSNRFIMPLPTWLPGQRSLDNWQRSAWDAKTLTQRTRSARTERRSRYKALKDDGGE
ncbi:MAG: potassium channel family protein [Terriglobia bacterium]